MDLSITSDSGFAGYLRKVYMTVAGGLLVSALVTFMLSMSPDLAHAFYHLSPNGKHAIQYSIGGWVALLLPLVLIFVMAYAAAQEWSSMALNAIYGIFCASFGVSMYAATSQYTGASVGAALLVTAGSFTGLSLTGLLVKTPLTGLKSFCTMGLWGLVLVGFADLIFHFSLNQTLMACISIGVFAGLTITDSQDMRDRYSDGGDTPGGVLIGAIGLYLDAINLFLNILQIMGNKNND